MTVPVPSIAVLAAVMFVPRTKFGVPTKIGFVFAATAEASSHHEVGAGDGDGAAERRQVVGRRTEGRRELRHGQFLVGARAGHRRIVDVDRDEQVVVVRRAVGGKLADLGVWHGSLWS